MPRYTPLTAVDEKLRELAERKKVKDVVCSMYLPSDDTPSDATLRARKEAKARAAKSANESNPKTRA